MIEYELSVGSKCNSFKINQVFKNELGSPRAIHYLTPPLLAILVHEGRLNVKNH